MRAAWLVSGALHGGAIIALAALGGVAALSVAPPREEPVLLSARVLPPRRSVDEPPMPRVFLRPVLPAEERNSRPEMPAIRVETEEYVEAEPPSPAPAWSVEELPPPVPAYPSGARYFARESPFTPMPLAGNPLPEYPRAARRAGVEGAVLVRLFIRASGEVERAEVARSSGSALLDEAARAALERWKFHPARGELGNSPYAVLVPVIFTLEGKCA